MLMLFLCKKIVTILFKILVSLVNLNFGLLEK